RLEEIDRGRVRSEFERRFSARRMAEDYLAVYRRLVKDQRSKLRVVGE
ncbi:MAG: glycosyltransferase family 4 protein, partial [Acidisphaera sp.]|nr:glycosyltransferase family 4 protein [Acidisphaera sp.]